MVSNFENSTWQNIYYEAQGILNQDGIKHLNGSKVRIYNCYFKKTGDDAISLMANDIWWPTNPPPKVIGSGQTAYDPHATYGPLTDYIVDGITLDDCKFAIRLGSGDQLVSNGVVRNVTGITKDLWLIMDNYSEGPKNFYGAGGVNSSVNVGHFANNVFEDINVSLVSTGYKEAYAFICAADAGTVTFTRYIVPNSNFQPYKAIKIQPGSAIKNLNVNFRYIPNPSRGKLLIDTTGVTNFNYTQY